MFSSKVIHIGFVTLNCLILYKFLDYKNEIKEKNKKIEMMTYHMNMIKEKADKYRHSFYSYDNSILEQKLLNDIHSIKILTNDHISDQKVS
jgi:hypothetical protein